MPFAQSPTEQMQLDFSCSASKSTWSALLALQRLGPAPRTVVASMSRSRQATDFAPNKRAGICAASWRTRCIQNEYLFIGCQMSQFPGVLI